MMVNVLSGQAGIEGLEILIVPSNVVWFDVLDGLGQVQTPGELRNILTAVNAILDAVGDLDLTNLGLSTIANFSDTAIDALFASRILAATISDLLLSQDLGGTTLVVPSAVFDIDPALVNGIIHETELSALVKAIKLLATQVACDPLDVDCDPDSFDVTKVLAMSESDIDLLLDSEIIAATFGKIIIDLGDSFLTIPNTVVTAVAVQSGSVDVVTKAEIKAVLEALMLLGLADFENFEFGPNILSSLELIPPVGEPTELDDTKISTLFASGIVHATISKMIIDLTSGSSNFLIIPEEDADGNDIFTTVSGTEFVTVQELNALLKAFYALDIGNFDELSSFSVDSVLSQISVLLDSAILHATFSKQIIDLEGTIAIPYYNAAGTLIRVSTGTLPNQTEFILASELELFVQAIEVFGIGDLSGFGGTIDLTILNVEANRNTILASAILHQTISNQLIAVEGSALTIPTHTEAGVPIRLSVGSNPNIESYVAAFEIHALLVALNAMGFDDLNSFSGAIDSASFFSDPDAILSSSILQATISDQLLNSTGGVLQVPNAERVTQGSTVYIKKVELTAIITVLDELGFTAFGSLDFDDPSTLFAMDPDVLVRFGNAPTDRFRHDLGDCSRRIRRRRYDDINRSQFIPDCRSRSMRPSSTKLKSTNSKRCSRRSTCLA
ncbi:MAG: hypothetical protein MZU97_24920 [Bacillus subtilis]|nr:hypothetical protein [Bacillus subtilis]